MSKVRWDKAHSQGLETPPYKLQNTQCCSSVKFAKAMTTALTVCKVPAHRYFSRYSQNILHIGRLEDTYFISSVNKAAKIY